MWLFVDTQGRTRFAPLACVLKDFGREEGAINATLEAFPCEDPETCGCLFTAPTALDSGGFHMGLEPCHSCVAMRAYIGHGQDSEAAIY